MMTIPSTAKKPNPRLRELARKRGEGNAAWVARAAGAMKDAESFVLLVGGAEGMALHLRMAQARARTDLSPSHFSHVGLIAGAPADSAPRTRLYEVPLPGDKGLNDAPTQNALGQGTLASYDDADAFPNVALVGVPLSKADVRRVAARVRMGRSHVDLCELLLEWLAFLWAVGDTPNPLLGGKGIPSAVAVELLLEYAGLGMTPNLASHASCPEAIWQAAKWWHDALRLGNAPEDAPAERQAQSPPVATCIGHRLR